MIKFLKNVTRRIFDIGFCSFCISAFFLAIWVFLDNFDHFKGFSIEKALFGKGDYPHKVVKRICRKHCQFNNENHQLSILLLRKSWENATHLNMNPLPHLEVRGLPLPKSRGTFYFTCKSRGICIFLLHQK